MKTIAITLSIEETESVLVEHAKRPLYLSTKEPWGAQITDRDSYGPWTITFTEPEPKPPAPAEVEKP